MANDVSPGHARWRTYGERSMKQPAREMKRTGLRCDGCGLEAIANPPIEQPSFHVFTDGVLCEDCYLKALKADK